MVELTEHGWDEPINKSPFDLPNGWQGGGVVNTGGNIFSRIWEHPQTNVKVVYNIEDPVVGVQRQEEPDSSIEILKTIETESTTDLDKRTVAKQYIHNEFSSSHF